jgi:hypothetical protein
LISQVSLPSLTKFGKETIARIYRKLKWVPYYNAQANSGILRILRLCSGMLTLVSGMLTLSSG